MKTENQNHVKWYESLTFKMALLGFMALMFLVPLQLIKMLITEREQNSIDVKLQISEQWGREQTISGPILNIPVYKRSDDAESIVKPVLKIWHVLPESLTTEARLTPEIRYKGIYETVIYESILAISGEFIIPENKSLGNYEILWSESYITFGISDNRGLKDRVSIRVNEKTIDASPGLWNTEVISSGITFPLELDQSISAYDFKLDLGLRGSSGINFVPVGKTTSVKLSSSWESPSFTGNFLPDERTIDNSGFKAEWNVTHLNRNFPQDWLGPAHNLDNESFGADLILEVDYYQKSERSAKYGMLFIAFTFLVMLFLELSSEKRIHIFNYFLVSLALVLFFSLLNALSEHIGFSPAYLIASLATIIMITGFTGSLLKERKSIIIISGMLTALYIFIYVLLALKEFSFLAGNIGLFIALAAIMRLSSKTDLFRKSEI